jgi:DivIVA domain-containing protein
MTSWVDRIISDSAIRNSGHRLAAETAIGQDLPEISGDGFPDPQSARRKANAMMNSPAPRLTAREIIAKTFSAKSRRGYDPAEVDAYLMDVARQVDELNLEIDRLTNEVVRLSFGQPAAAAAPAPAPSPAAVEAPPPPPPPATVLPSISATEAEEESLKLILKAAQKTAEQTITDARGRAEEILAEARFRAAEVTRESDRKAFEAASRAQGELASLEDQLTARKAEIESLSRSVEVEKGRVRALAQDLLRTVGDEARAPSAPPVALEPPPAPAPANADAMVLDLTNEESSNATATTPGGTGGFRNDFESYSPFGNES